MKFTIWTCIRTMPLLVAVAFTFALAAQAQTYSVLYTFTGGADGAQPWAGLIRDADGNLYGTTFFGGDSGYGVVFKLDTAGNETVLHSFSGGADGYWPAGLIRDSAGNLYGTTPWGGDFSCGVVFKMDSAGNETVMHSFGCHWGAEDGATPYAGLVQDQAGNLYGTTWQGGASGGGTVFKLRAGTLTVLHGFAGTDGASPYAGLIRDTAGNLYGTTSSGGDLSCKPPYGCGVVFKLDKAGKLTVLHNFAGGTDGATPYAGLIRDSAGNLYGTTQGGGAYDGGTVFKLDTSTTGKEKVLYSFSGGADGAQPWAGLIRDADGNLYGTTFYGGDLSCNPPYGCGVMFKLDTADSETVLHTFTGGADGTNPIAGLISDTAGNFYGTTRFGGGSGYGVVFKLAP